MEISHIHSVHQFEALIPGEQVPPQTFRFEISVDSRGYFGQVYRLELLDGFTAFAVDIAAEWTEPHSSTPQRAYDALRIRFLQTFCPVVTRSPQQLSQVWACGQRRFEIWSDSQIQTFSTLSQQFRAYARNRSCHKVLVLDSNRCHDQANPSPWLTGPTAERLVQTVSVGPQHRLEFYQGPQGLSAQRLRQRVLRTFHYSGPAAGLWDANLWTVTAQRALTKSPPARLIRELQTSLGTKSVR